MQDIKFRAWDGLEVFDIWSLYWFEEEGVVEIKDGKASGHNQSFSIMQYTGLKDKNGVEIYEGDIVVNTDISGSGSKRVFRPRSVRWIDDMCEFNVSKPTQYGAEIEIIGNIYENPELLQQENAA